MSFARSKKVLTACWLRVDCLATAITWKVIYKPEEELSISENYWVQLG